MKKGFITCCMTLFFFASFLHAQLTVVTNNLTNPIGVSQDDAGNILVAETGTGATDGRILVVRPNGDKVPIIVGLPSFNNVVVGDIVGPWRTMQLSNNRMAVIIGGFGGLFGRIMIFNMANFVPGTSAAKTLRDTMSTIDIAGFVLAQPNIIDSDIYSAALDKDNNWYVADAGANLIVKVTPTGQKSIFVKFPPLTNSTPIGPPFVDFVPTKIIAKPDSGFYVCNLTGFPFAAGTAAVYNVSASGVVTPYITNLSLLTDMALDPRTGDLYVHQFGSFGFAPAPGFVFGSGKVSRFRRGSTTAETIATNFGPGAGMTLDRNGNLFVTSLFTAQLLKMNNVGRCNSLELSITADNNRLDLYSSIKYSLQVTNRGTTNAPNVRVFWLPPYKRFEGDPKPFAYQAAYASKGRYDSWRGIWDIPNLAPGETATAYFHLFVVDNTKDARQIAQVGGCNEAFTYGAMENNADYSVSFVTPAPKNTEGGLLSKSDLFNISPNPANTRINVHINPKTDAEWSVKMVNRLGQIVKN